MPLLATPSPCVFFFALLVDPDPTLYSTVIQRIIVRILFGSVWIVIDSGTIANQNNNVQFYCSETLQLLIRIFVFYETINCRSFASEPSIQSIYTEYLFPLVARGVVSFQVRIHLGVHGSAQQPINPSTKPCPSLQSDRDLLVENTHARRLRHSLQGSGLRHDGRLQQHTSSRLTVMAREHCSPGLRRGRVPLNRRPWDSWNKQQFDRPSLRSSFCFFPCFSFSDKFEANMVNSENGSFAFHKRSSTCLEYAPERTWHYFTTKITKIAPTNELTKLALVPSLKYTEPTYHVPTPRPTAPRHKVTRHLPGARYTATCEAPG